MCIRDRQVIDRTLAFREIVGDYQRQLFLVDHAGLPIDTVLDQLDMLGELVVPVLRREFAVNRPPNVPEEPVHPRVLAAQAAARAARQSGHAAQSPQAAATGDAAPAAAGLDA